MELRQPPNLTVDEIEDLCDKEVQIESQTCPSHSMRDKVLIGSFALLLSVSSPQVLQAVTKPNNIDEDIILQIENEWSTLDNYCTEISTENIKLVFDNSDLIDGNEIEDEIEFLSKYNETVKSYYKEQKKPFII